MLFNLEHAISSHDETAVQDALFELSPVHQGIQGIEDEVVFEILKILSSKEMKSSALAGHILNFFEFEAKHLSQAAKKACAAFLKKEGAEFSAVHSAQVVTELIHGPYLR